MSWSPNPRQAGILREMNLGPLWRVRGRPPIAAPSAVAGAHSLSAAPAVAHEVGSVVRPARTVGAHLPTETSSARDAAPVISQNRPPHSPLRQVWPGEKASTAAVSPAPQPLRKPEERTSEPAHVRTSMVVLPADASWEQLEAQMRDCTACGLCGEGRMQVVPGVGDRQARWLLVGEGPGAEEDRRGEPFVGAAGKLLDAMLAALGLQRGVDVYITNAVKCRPAFNRTPSSDEIAACRPYLQRQIELIQPELIVALGRPAAQALLEQDVKINAARGRVFERHGTPVVVTYHPAYLLRNMLDKRRAWEDLCFARRVLRERTSP